MRLPLEWLRDYIEIDMSAEELAHRLTMAGLAVENIEKVENDTILELDLTPNRVTVWESSTWRARWRP